MTDAPLIDPLVAQILEANSRGLARTTNMLIDSLTAQLDEAQATNKAIREGIDALFAGPYMPTPAMVLSALWPPEEAIDRYRQHGAPE